MSGGPWEIGTRDDPESAVGSGTVIAILKRVRSLLTGGVGSIDVSDRIGRLLGLVGISAGVNAIGTVGVTVIPDVDPVTATPTAYNVTLTNANTEYSQAMPGNCRGFEFQCRTEADVRYAFVTGKVAGPAAPWLTLKAGDYYYSPPINQGAAPSTLYFASATAGVIMEVISWV